MPLEAPLAPVGERVLRLNARNKNRAAIPVLSRALRDPEIGRVALISSFGAESVALLHMVSVIDRSIPVIFVDTEMLFAETLAYQQELAQKLGLTDIRIIQPSAEQKAAIDPFSRLHLANPDACCALRKTVPLEAALSGFDAWITGRKRYQASTRQKLELFENEDDRRIKINPLALWDSGDVQDYIINNRLPRHPLIAKGYPSIGCAPCTSPVRAGEDARSGRWRGQDKIECGIHVNGGNITRSNLQKG